MEYYIARIPVFNRRKEIFGYKLLLCRSLVQSYLSRYTQPEDAQALYRQLCFTQAEDGAVKPMAILEYNEELFESLVPLLPREDMVVEYGLEYNNEITDMKDITKLKAQGYQVLYAGADMPQPGLLPLVDIVRIDFKAMSLEAQYERLQALKEKVRFYVSGIDTWEDYKKALAIGYEYFEGDFFMKPAVSLQSSMRSFNITILRVLSELNEAEPSYREITTTIEHDLNLSYRLLRLVNSAYIAPRFKVKTISQAVTILGLNELNQFMTSLLMKQMQSHENNELLQRSLIRGKYLDLLANARGVQQKGSEAFFVGIFSFIDVILNKPMAEILEELPLTDGVKETLLSGTGELKKLLDMVSLYEEGRWDVFEATFNLDLTEQETMVDLYIDALKWAESFDL